MNTFKPIRKITSVLYFLFTATAALAQFTAGIQGNVRDTGAANVANAQMTLVNTATKVQQAGASDASGLYRFTNLGPGDYQISASANGFQRAQAQFTLTAAEIRDVSLTLNVGSGITNVVVTAEAPLLDTADSREALTLNQAALENLPLATRNLFNRVNLMPVDAKLQHTTLGQSTSTYAARNMLLGARVNF